MDRYKSIVEAAREVEAYKQGEIDEITMVDTISEMLNEMSKADFSALKSQLRRLISHAIKWDIQPELRTASWKSSALQAFDEIEDALADSPSMRHKLNDQVWKDSLKKAARRAAVETGISSKNIKTDQYSLKQMLAGDHPIFHETPNPPLARNYKKKLN